ncbi:MAG: hypothetical protein OXI24_21385 [Candidatus Poribacteria bacterium]|nr:hypothetical protein [Candidatus Poribacteria bacterium]
MLEAIIEDQDKIMADLAERDENTDTNQAIAQSTKSLAEDYLKTIREYNQRVAAKQAETPPPQFPEGTEIPPQ